MSSNPFWPPDDPRGPKPQLAHRQVQVVADDQQVFVGQLVKTLRLLDACAAQVHEGRGTQQQRLLAAQVGLDHRAVKPRLGRAGAELSGQLGQDGIADVVPRPLVPAARIAQPNHELHRLSFPPTPLPPSPSLQ